MSRQRIVEAAITLADDEGLDAVSMRRVAKQLGAGAMSLYRHVADKEELLREMMEVLHVRYAYPDPGDLDWRSRMHLLARHDWDMYTAHPWLLTATATLAPPAGPYMLASMEWALRALEPLGLSAPESGRAIMSVNHYLQGSARLALSGGSSDLADTDPGDAWRRRLGTEDLSNYPRVAALVDSDSDQDGQGGDWVTAGLEMVLDGIAAHAASRGSAGAGP